MQTRTATSSLFRAGWERAFHPSEKDDFKEYSSSAWSGTRDDFSKVGLLFTRCQICELARADGVERLCS
jgi:hypothetical protein